MMKYAKNVYLKDSTASLLMEAKIKFMKDKKTDRCGHDDVIKEALGVYLYGKSGKD